MFIQCFDLSGSRKDQSVVIKDDVFPSSFNNHLIALAVRKRFCNSKQRGYTKSRGSISHTKRKIFAQKGRGAARHRNMSSNIFRGGAKAHGPKGTRSVVCMNKKSSKIALKHSFLAKIKDNSCFIISNFSYDKPSTKKANELISSMDIKNPLFIYHDSSLEKNFILSVRNMPGVDVLPYYAINVFDILRHRCLVFSEYSFDKTRGVLNV